MTTELTPERLAELQERAEAATPGEWVDFVLGSEGYSVLADNPGRLRRLQVARCGHEAWEVDKANAEHFAAFDPPTVLALVAEIERLRARLAIADDVAAMTGWTAIDQTERGLALEQLWRRWAAQPEISTDPSSWPHLDDQAIAVLAEERRRSHAAIRRRLEDHVITTTGDRS